MTADTTKDVYGRQEKDVYGRQENKRLRQTRIRTFMADKNKDVYGRQKRQLRQKSNVFSRQGNILTLNVYGQPEGRCLRPTRKGRLSRRSGNGT